MQVLVRWDGVDVEVELRPVECADKSGPVRGLLRGSFGNPTITIDRSNGALDEVSWDSTLVGPECFSDTPKEYPPTLRGTGRTAQGSLDVLAERLTALAEWSYSALHPGQEELVDPGIVHVAARRAADLAVKQEREYLLKEASHEVTNPDAGSVLYDVLRSRLERDAGGGRIWLGTRGIAAPIWPDPATTATRHPAYPNSATNARS